ncbi:glycosyltransferase family 2 protein [Desulfatirhabdium butyrativorans]|uniref:glycosyltransferase family 2 protein n=1 Tax=Desulfatirhabdium butyrativorans TaxID=340467 RepID=UPI001FE064F7|nr:glycosyltransferase [Desulfatirhabdium butyrativorans]
MGTLANSDPFAMKMKGETADVTVVIPTWNRARSVVEAIDSVLAQSAAPREILVVDDGSTDDTVAALENYGDTIRVLRLENNRGVSAARNRGIEAAAGRYIAFLDSDDLWLSRKLEVQMAYVREHPESRIHQTDEIWIRNGVRVNPGKRHQKPEGWIFEPSLHLCLISPSAVMIEKRLFDEVGLFDERFPACEDYDMWLRITCRFPVGLVRQALIVKRGGHSDQLSRLPVLDKYRIESIRNLLKSGMLSDAQVRAAVDVLRVKCAIYATGCRKRGRLAEAERYLRMARGFDESCF